MNIFITGVTGFIGRNFLSQLFLIIKPSDNIFILLRKKIQYEDSRINSLFGRLEEIEKFKDEILRCDYFFHLAANPIYGSNSDYDKVNYEPTVQIVDILKKSKVLKNFIYISTIGAVDRMDNADCKEPITLKSSPNPTSLYGKSKLKSEVYITNSCIPFTIIRPSWVYGEYMRFNSHINKFVTMVYEKSIISRFNFPGKVSLINVHDLSKAMVNCIKNNRIIGKIYFAETEAFSIGNIFRIIFLKINQKKIMQIYLPRFNFIFKRLHSKLPLALSNLFLDYLWARDDFFQKDFNLQEIRPFYKYVDDVINTNKYNGYWIITGANSGIGYALSEHLEKLKKKLILIDKDISNLIQFNNQIIFKVDLRDLNQLFALVKNIDQYRIFCLINNAGVGFRGGLKDLDLEQIKNTIYVNVSYPVIFTKLLLDNLISNESTIVNIASSSAYNPLPHMSLYSSSKAFLSNFSESLSYELRKTNKVITFSPSGTYSNFQKNAGVKVINGGKGLLSTEYVANRIIKSVYGFKSVIILGFMTKYLLLISKIIPRKYNILLWGKLFEKLR